MRTLKNRYAAILMALVLALAGGLSAQTATDPGADVPAADTAQEEKSAVAETPQAEAVKARETVKKGERAAAKKEEPAQERKSADLGDAGGLMDIQDGDFLYRRIPDKKFPETTQPGLEGFDVGGATIQPAGAETPEMSQRKGLFGMSADGTSYLAKGMLLFIIILIVVLYRLRSRTRSSTVHKSFR